MRIILATCLLTGTLLFAAPRVNAEQVLINSHGLWDLSKMGASDVYLANPGPELVPVAAYRLPKGVSQGPEEWYVGRWHFQVRLGPPAELGTAYISAWSNDQAWAQIQFDSFRFGNNTVTHWVTKGLLDNRRDFYTMAPTIEYTFYNALTYDAVQEGKNEIQVNAAAYRGADVVELTTFADSGILFTDATPPWESTSQAPGLLGHAFSAIARWIGAMGVVYVSLLLLFQRFWLQGERGKIDEPSQAD